ncbi:hypothetical protein TVAG_454310 [Trichomonas vaginalis G3]|uniref:Uncharacterized protein n=1 Tax=Trichomonas vaginalis (strain ATCC PRA-98 / G3) TaxID=412133 RepID=A2EU44_TRIV3|nr:ankyrin repeat protein family [Trichomonas vaginalis G3]EAY03792.1 hypothetical protein TVAG_454310 [Trichomonas vaginalis G3]KAI5552621.1 ankyrin repeat protein family [Trichomonas vaginalis G3]|eukprot:XP_001316015.1 hypothetical protein [Trichomonas vaginalis G3]
MKYSKLTPKQFNSLLKQSSSTINASKLYVCTRNANVTVQSINDVVSVLKSVKTYMKFKIFDGVIDFLLQNDKETRDHAEENKKLREQIQSFQILTKIAELKKSNDFDRVYKFFEELSSEGNREMMSRACEEELWEKTAGWRQNVLHIACGKGNFKLVKLLIECGCDKEVNDGFDFTPLIRASREGHLEIVKYLISVGANKEGNPNKRISPLVWASWNGHLEVVKYLIYIGANKEARGINGETPLFAASEEDHLEIVKYLISIGVNKEAMNDDGYTPLSYASWNGHLEVVKYLISFGADKEAKNKNGWTPLICASWKNHFEVVKYLISVGANKDAKDYKGKTALSHAKGKVRDYLKSIGAK